MKYEQKDRLTVRHRYVNKKTTLTDRQTDRQTDKMRISVSGWIVDR